MPPTHAKFTLYVRAARHRRFKQGQRIEASMRPNYEPLVVGTPGSYEGEEAVHTAFFKLDLKVPWEMLQPESMLTFEVEIKVWTAPDDNPNVGARLIREELDRVFSRRRATDLPFNLSKTMARCVDLRPLPGGGLDLDEGRTEGKDVVIVRRKWECLVQGKV